MLGVPESAQDAQDPVLSIVVPVYRSAASLDEFVRRTDAALADLGVTFEYVFVDDDSGDDSWPTLVRLGAARSDFRAYRLMRNFGQHNALMCGFKHARGQFVVTIDDDLQNPPEEIPNLYHTLINSSQDVVFGYFKERRHGLFRNLTSDLARWLLVRSIPRLNPHYSNYRIMRRSVVDALARQPTDFLYTDGMITWVTGRTAHIRVRHDERYAGTSNYTLRKLIAYFAVIIFTFTVLPLRVLTLTGASLSLGGLLLGAIYLITKLTGHVTEEGFAALIVSVLVLGGIQLLSLAVIGEYVGKIFLKQSHKPQFIVRQSLGDPNERHPAVRSHKEGL